MKKTVNYFLTAAIAIMGLSFSSCGTGNYGMLNYGLQIGNMVGNAVAQGIAHDKKYDRGDMIKNIKKWGECKTGVLTCERGAVAVYGTNGYYYSATVPEGFKEKLKKIHNDGDVIDDVHITEGGKWIVIFDKGRNWTGGSLPADVLKALRDLPSFEAIKSVSFTDGGTYAILTEEKLYTNRTMYRQLYEDKVEEGCEPLSVNINGDGAVFCFSEGTYYCGKVPNNVVEAVGKCRFAPQFVKYNNRGHYLICSKYGEYSYSIGDGDQGSLATTTNYDYSKQRWNKKINEANGKYKVIDSSNEKYYFVKTEINFKGKDYDDIKFQASSAIGKTSDSAPIVIFDFTKIIGVGKEAPYVREKMDNQTLKINFTDGEIFTSAYTQISPNIIIASLHVIASSVDIRSNRKSLLGTADDIRYVVRKLCNVQIESIEFCGTTVDMSEEDTKGKFIVCFSKLKDIATSKKWFPTN